jgi:hypothetical protein
MGREDRRRGDESKNSLKQHFKERAGSSFTMLSQWIVAPDVEEMSMRVTDTGRQYQAEQARIKLKLNEEARGNVISFGRIFRRVWFFHVFCGFSIGKWGRFIEVISAASRTNYNQLHALTCMTSCLMRGSIGN